MNDSVTPIGSRDALFTSWFEELDRNEGALLELDSVLETIEREGGEVQDEDLQISRVLWRAQAQHCEQHILARSHSNFSIAFSSAFEGAHLRLAVELAEVVNPHRQDKRL